MRRLILFVVAVAMVLGGSYLLILQFTASQLIWGKLVFAGAGAVVIGLYLLWADFIAPNLRSRGGGGS